MKPKKCKICKNTFTPKYTTTQMVCSPICAMAYTKQQEKKRWNKEKKERRDALKTQSDWLKEVQTQFNRYIRLRDKNKPCISCGKPLVGKYDAGHYYSVGSTPELRFDADNVHGQCVACNQHLHGNLIEYTERLPLRIGDKRFEQLKSRRGKIKKYSIEELKEMKAKYRRLGNAMQKKSDI